jgi:DNA-binding winged helix-turn-helix (wHTH) protein
MNARPGRLVSGDLEVDLARHEVRLAGSILKLEPHAMDLLLLLMEREGELVTRGEIAARLWRPGTHVAVDDGINTAVRKLRTVLADDPRRPRYVATVVARGYKFVPRVERRGDPEAALAAFGRIVWGDRSVMLQEGDNVIGRDPAARIRIDSSTVSRRHAVIRVNGPAAVVEDLCSKNGTSVNGAPVATPVPLLDGDRIDVGGVRLVFVRPSQSRTRTLLRE